MKSFLASYSKQLEIAFLLVLLVAMDLAKINDAELKYTLMALLGALTGFRGAAAGFSGLTSIMSGSQPATQTAAPALPQASMAPVQPATPAQ